MYRSLDGNTSSFLAGGRSLIVELMGHVVGKESTCNAGDPGFIPGLGRSPGEDNGNPLQYSCLGNPMDRGAWWGAVHRVPESDMTEVT